MLQKPPMHVAVELQQSAAVLHASPDAEQPPVGIVHTGVPPSSARQKPAQHW
jgi:hypothetical protein